jgi:transcription elongation factor GreA
MSKEALMSKNKLTEYEKELEYLKTIKRKEIAEIIKEARSHGDLSENSEYDEAKNTQAMIESRIAEIEKMLQNAKVIDEDELTTDKVGIGCVVKVKDMDEGEVETYAIVSSGESDAMAGKISDESPVGSALMEHKVGDICEVTVPSGLTLRYKVMEIGKQSFS